MTPATAPILQPGEPLAFDRDHHLRRRLFVEQSFQHKARTNLHWLAWLLDQYTDPGQIVLDPMGGAGSILLAAVKRRPVLTGDVEPHWARLQSRNALEIRTGMLFPPAATLTCQWNAARLPIPAGDIPAIVTSPPYFDLFSDWNRTNGHALDGRHVGETGLCYGFHDRQLGNIHIYENYLRAMRQVYREYWRILRPGGILVLIVGDRVKKARIVPITADTAALCQANGFDLVDRHQTRTHLSQYRNIHAKQQGAGYPLIETETALVLQKQNYPPRQAKQRFALLQAPPPNSRPSQQLFDKALAHVHVTADQILVLTKDGLIRGHVSNDVSSLEGPKPIWSGDHERKARARKDWAFAIARDLVTKHGLGAGDQIALHVSLRYARYLHQRLNTFGARATIPTARYNLGQKLAWYTGRALDRLAAGSQPNAVSPDGVGSQPYAISSTIG